MKPNTPAFQRFIRCCYTTSHHRAPTSLVDPFEQDLNTMRHSLLVTTILGSLCVAAPTEQEDVNSSLVQRTGAVYKVKDLTGPDLTGGFQAGYTDLGIPALTPDGRLIFVCGDTFVDKVGGANWRAPVGLYSSNANLDQVNIDGCVGGSEAVGLVPESHDGGTTAIPSDVFAANGKLYMNLMRGVIYQTVSKLLLYAFDSHLTSRCRTTQTFGSATIMGTRGITYSSGMETCTTMHSNRRRE